MAHNFVIYFYYFWFAYDIINMILLPSVYNISSSILFLKKKKFFFSFGWVLVCATLLISIFISFFFYRSWICYTFTFYHTNMNIIFMFDSPHNVVLQMIANLFFFFLFFDLRIFVAFFLSLSKFVNFGAYWCFSFIDMFASCFCGSTKSFTVNIDLRKSF